VPATRTRRPVLDAVGAAAVDVARAAAEEVCRQASSALGPVAGPTTVGDHLGDEVTDALLDDRGHAPREQCGLRGVDVDPDDVVPLSGETGCGDATDVPETEHGQAWTTDVAWHLSPLD